MPKKTIARTEKLAKDIINASDTCVRCGLCLPHCPTYQVNEVESESPRGRIAMAKAFAEKNVALTDSMENHLDNCLSCLACEAMCPAKVPYHQLIVDTRELQAENKPTTIPFLLKFLLNHLNLIPWLQRLYKFYISSGLAWVFSKIGIEKLFGINQYADFMPKSMRIADFKSQYTVKGAKGSVALFLGCINQLCDAGTIYKAIELLNDLGYNVHIPKSQACCGAIHLHNGDPLQSQVYLKQNAKAFDDLQIDAILTMATGCNSSLKQLNSFSKQLPPIIDINAFLLTEDLASAHKIDEQAGLLIHTPCTLKNSMKQPQLLIELFQKLGVKQIKQIKNYGCCGAAGLNMWKKPELANALAAPLVKQIIAEKPDFVVTANIGCQLHLQKCLDKKGLKTRILHPANLIFLKKPQKT